jgi:hypothetical protein
MNKIKGREKKAWYCALNFELDLITVNWDIMIAVFVKKDQFYLSGD